MSSPRWLNDHADGRECGRAQLHITRVRSRQRRIYWRPLRHLLRFQGAVVCHNIEPSLRARGGCIQRSIYGANVSVQTRDMASVTYIRKDDSPEPVRSSSGRTRNPCIDTLRTVLDRIQVSATAGGAKPLSFLRIEKPCDVPTQPRSSYSAQSRRGHLHIVHLVRVRLPPKRRCLAEEY